MQLKVKKRTLRPVISERNRLAYLLFFYKTTSQEQEFLINEIKKYNQIIDAKKLSNPDNVINSKNSNEQFEFFLRKFCENNSVQNFEKTKTKYLEMLRHR